MRLFAESVKAIIEGREVPENDYKGDYVQDVARLVVHDGYLSELFGPVNEWCTQATKEKGTVYEGCFICRKFFQMKAHCNIKQRLTKKFLFYYTDLLAKVSVGVGEKLETSKSKTNHMQELVIAMIVKQRV
ncbi:MAG: hypothetical protein R2688_04745 [Fimbriimonadaceae bacterium]